MPMDVPTAPGERVVSKATRDSPPSLRSAPMTRLCPSRTRRLRSISRANGTRSGVVQSPSMKDSPMPMSLPVSVRRKNRSSWTTNVASRSSPSPNRYVRPGHSRVSAPPFRPLRPERNIVSAHCFNIIIAPSIGLNGRRANRRQRRPDRPFRHSMPCALLRRRA